MKNRNLLPEQFFIKPDYESMSLWHEYIDWLNTDGHQLTGNLANTLYGMDDDLPTCKTSYEAQRDGILQISLDDWNQAINLNIEYVDPQTIVSNGDVHPTRLCVELHDGTWELKSRCTLTTMEGEWALNEDVHTEYFGSTYIEGNEDISYSEYHGEEIDTTHDRCRYGWISRRDEGYFSAEDSVCFSESYYSDDHVANQHGIYWSDRRGEYYDSNYESDDDYDDDDENNDDDEYRGSDQSDNNSRYDSLADVDKSTAKTVCRIGFEVEKEDENACGIHYRAVYDRTGWGKERDGSLNERRGYELVSPIFDLFTNDMDNDLKDEDLITLINASHSHKCGGHINISHSKYSPDELFEGISGFIPLLYSMYENRLDKYYSQAKRKHQYFVSRDKYSSFFIKDNRVEIRLPSAVKSVKNLLWRRDLMRIIMQNINASEVDVLKMIVNQRSKLYKHLRIIYTQSQVLTKIEKFIKYSKMYNNKVLDNVDVSKIKSDGLSNSINNDEVGA